MIPELISLEGESETLREVMEPGDYNYLMGSENFTNRDIQYFQNKYPEYMGGIWKAIGKALKAIGKGITKGARRKRGRRQARQIQAARAVILRKHEEIRKHNRRVIQAEQMYRRKLQLQSLEQQKRKQLASFLIPAAGITALAFLLL
jgi:hypothetical protein